MCVGLKNSPVSMPSNYETFFFVFWLCGSILRPMAMALTQKKTWVVTKHSHSQVLPQSSPNILPLEFWWNCRVSSLFLCHVLAWVYLILQPSGQQYGYHYPGHMPWNKACFVPRKHTVAYRTPSCDNCRPACHTYFARSWNGKSIEFLANDVSKLKVSQKMQ